VIGDDSLAVEPVCAAFGLAVGPGASITALSRGAVGRIWQLNLGADRYAVKELFAESDEESACREVRFTTHLQAAGIRLPGSVPDRDGRYLVPLTGYRGDRWLRLYRWVDGVPADPADPSLAAQIGDLVGRLHAHALPAWCEHDPWYETTPEPALWDQLADAALLHEASWAQALTANLGLLSGLAELVAPAARDQMVTCHRDLHPGNVLVDSAGDFVLLDWDDAGPACPDQELAGLLAFWHIDDDGRADDAAVGRTLAAYRSAGGPGHLRDERSFSMYIATRLNFLHSQATVALDPATAPGHRQYAVSEVWDTLARLPSLSLISHLTSLAKATYRTSRPELRPVVAQPPPGCASRDATMR
jgi:Ser/Thr protein kinase RdoA (MazF antagonist)